MVDHPAHRGRLRHPSLGLPHRVVVPTVALSLTLAGIVIGAGPAAADTNTYADPVGDVATNPLADPFPSAYPTVDITQYTVTLTETSLSVTVQTNTPATDPVAWTADITVGITVDGVDDYNASAEIDHWSIPDGRVNAPMWWDVYGPGGSFACDGYLGYSRAGVASFTIDSGCVGHPSRVNVSVVVRDGAYTDSTFSTLAPRGFLLPVDAGPDTAPTTAPIVRVYRFWSSAFQNAHFYTTDEAEAEHVYTSDTNWAFEGEAFGALAAAGETCQEGSPMYRFWSPVFSSHFYTTSADEKKHIVTADRNWQYEGVAYCAFADQQPGTVPLYRFWSPNFGKHFFTANQAEADHIRAVDRNWQYEGIAAYVLPQV